MALPHSHTTKAFHNVAYAVAGIAVGAIGTHIYDAHSAPKKPTTSVQTSRPHTARPMGTEGEFTVYFPAGKDRHNAPTAIIDSGDGTVGKLQITYKDGRATAVKASDIYMTPDKYEEVRAQAERNVADKMKDAPTLTP